MVSKTQSFSELAKTISSLPQKFKQRIVAIDGGGGAGKSTFAEHLKAALPHAEIIHIDDFYLGPWKKRLDHTDYVINPLFDWKRFEAELLVPIREGRSVSYHVYDWHKHTTDEVASIPQGAVIIVEGMYTTQNAFTDAYDFKIWIEADRDLRLKKAMLRDGEHMRFLWEEDWLPVEKNYIEKDNPASRADLVVQGHTSDFSKGYFEIAG